MLVHITQSEYPTFLIPHPLHLSSNASYSRLDLLEESTGRLRVGLEGLVTPVRLRREQNTSLVTQNVSSCYKFAWSIPVSQIVDFSFISTFPNTVRSKVPTENHTFASTLSTLMEAMTILAGTFVMQTMNYIRTQNVSLLIVSLVQSSNLCK